MSNDYNSPLSQSLRMRAAGLNPYENVDSIPASSAGTGSAAQAFPLTDPLVALKTFSEVGLNETQSQKILSEVALLDLQFERGLLEQKEYERRLELLFEEWNNANPYTVERENTQADTASKTANANLAKTQADDLVSTRQYRIDELESQHQLNVANAGLALEKAISESELRPVHKSNIESETNLNNARRITEDRLRDFKQAQIQADTALKASLKDQSVADTANAIVEGDILSQNRDLKGFIVEASKFYGFDISQLPSELQALLTYNYSQCVVNSDSPQYDTLVSQALSNAKEALDLYQVKALWTPRTQSGGANVSFGFGLLSIGANGTNSR